ncbi:MAG: hypothetical protein AB1480_01055 [Nitrospirota bacterium]
MEEINILIEQRIKKLEELRQSGIEPFGSFLMSGRQVSLKE